MRILTYAMTAPRGSLSYTLENIDKRVWLNLTLKINKFMIATSAVCIGTLRVRRVECMIATPPQDSKKARRDWGLGTKRFSKVQGLGALVT
jgi:hypothetical protein